MIIDLISLSVNSDHQSEHQSATAPSAVDRGEQAETLHSALLVSFKLNLTVICRVFCIKCIALYLKTTIPYIMIIITQH